MDNSFLDLLNSDEYSNSSQYQYSQNTSNPHNSQHRFNMSNFSNFSNNPNLSHGLIPNSQNESNVITSQDNITQPSPSTITKKTRKKKSENAPWREKEDEALMSSWLMASTNAIVGKNQTQITRWLKVLQLYDEIRNENPSEIGPRNSEALRQRYRVLSANASKWISCYKSILSRPRKSGTNDQDLENAAQELYQEEYKSRYVDLKLFKNFFSQLPKWSLEIDEQQHVELNANEVTLEESGGSSKRSRVNESDESNPPTPPSITRPEGRDAAKKKRNGKDKACTSSINNEYLEKIDALSVNMAKDHDLLRRKLEMEEKRLDLEMKKTEMQPSIMEMTLFNTLLSKQSLTPSEESMKEKLIAKYYS